jgi:hypothetical protein
MGPHGLSSQAFGYFRICFCAGSWCCRLVSGLVSEPSVIMRIDAWVGIASLCCCSCGVLSKVVGEILARCARLAEFAKVVVDWARCDGTMVVEFGFLGELVGKVRDKRFAECEIDAAVFLVDEGC